MLEQITIEENEDFEFDLSEIGLQGFDLCFEFNDESNQMEIFITGNNQIFEVKDLVSDSLINEDNEKLFINSEQQEVINNLLKSLLENNTNKIE